LSSVPTIIHG